MDIPAPPVTVGDGSTRAVRPLPEVAPPAVATVPTPDELVATATGGWVVIPLGVQSISADAIADQTLSGMAGGVLPAWTGTEPDDVTGGWFGLMGLVLMPLAGVWLGYRQARAQRAAGQIISG